MSIKPKALVLNAPGINCNAETGFAFEQAGAETEQVHVSQLQSGERSLDDYHILALSGGFSHGDAIRSGAILGTQLREEFPDELNRFVEAGRAVVGICNGFQILVESGLLPNGKILEPQEKEVSLVHNKKDKFENRWTHMRVEDSSSKFISQATLGCVIELPVAHGEGRLVTNGSLDYTSLMNNRQVPLRYSQKGGMPTEDYPLNPNGSTYGITALCDESGVVLGMMPHPERFTQQRQHPRWRRGDGQFQFGAIIFKNIVDYAKRS